MQSGAGATADTRADVSTWARGALASMSEVPGVVRVGLAVPEGGGRRLRFIASDRADRGPVEWCHVDAYDDVPLNTAIRTGKPVVGALDQLAGRYAEFVDRQRGTATVAVAALPLVAAGRTVGGCVLFFEDWQEFGPVQRRELARRGALLAAGLRRVQRSRPSPPLAAADRIPGQGTAVAVHSVAPDPAAVSESRRFLRRTLEAWEVDEETTDRAVLCLSEVVTNAVVHAEAGCVVRVVREQDVVTTTVRDGGSTGSASPAPVDDPLQGHGRGLHLLDALATRWGSEPDTLGTTVWFVLAI